MASQNGTHYTVTMIRPFVIAFAILLLAGNVFAQNIFLVRHAERADTANGGAPTMGSDPELSAAGHARAESLASMLKDAGISTIFVTEYKRTQQTAAPLAKALGLTPTVINAKDTPGLVTQLRQIKGNALVVGHSNSVPTVIAELGVKGAPAIEDDEYDNLFIVTQPRDLIQLRFR
jgi:phosphohistidine phosphatase SixA